MTACRGYFTVGTVVDGLVAAATMTTTNAQIVVAANVVLLQL